MCFLHIGVSSALSVVVIYIYGNTILQYFKLVSLNDLRQNYNTTDIVEDNIDAANDEDSSDSDDNEDSSDSDDNEYSSDSDDEVSSDSDDDRDIINNNKSHLIFSKFMNLTLGIVKIATIDNNSICKTSNIVSRVFGDVVYVVINGTNVCYPFPRQSLKHYPVLNRRIDGSFNTDNVIKTPDDNIILVLNDFDELEFPEMFRFVFVYVMTGDTGRYIKEGSDFHKKLQPIFDFYGMELKVEN